MSDFKRNLAESADAAARVGVLFVAVAMFAVMWESDSPPADVSDNWLARRAGVSRPATAPDERLSKSDKNSGLRETSSLLTGVSASSAIVVEYPLPAGIAPGRYRAVDSLGNVQTVRVTSEMATGIRAKSPLAQYIVEQGDRTIYFIRIQGGNEIADARAESVRR